MLQVFRVPVVDLSRAVMLRPVTVDDIALIRYIHEAAFQCYSAEYHSVQEAEAFYALLRHPAYGLEILNGNVSVAMIGGDIVGTAGWTPANDRRATARLNKVFVRPLFGGSGIGRMLVLDAEKRAARAGFFDFSARATVNAADFYRRLGYKVSSYGVFAMPGGVDLPVTYMRKVATLPKGGLH